MEKCLKIRHFRAKKWLVEGLKFVPAVFRAGEFARAPTCQHVRRRSDTPHVCSRRSKEAQDRIATVPKQAVQKHC